ncbi:nucleoporin NDC1 isoform X2 [Rhinatrema bivittatum]|uniref:nucleoporin NDC1 isoform X2 n=1 Tax=Rhinatrema bivittatum TaxID=194408 RepID=UPI00112DADD0|nr:nucleoporin NDC1 isoform X2 [Rhinatrema bivittatum]
MSLLRHEHWVLSKVLSWRIAASVAWSVLLLPVCTAVFILLTRVDLFHPIQWISGVFSDLNTSYSVFCMLLMSVVLVIISIFNCEFYTVVPSIPCSRLALIGKVVHPQRVIHSLAHAIMGILVAWCAAVITRGEYQFLTVPCTVKQSLEDPSSKTCLNEYHLFLLLAGAFIGYSYSLLYFINNMNYLAFPAIQQYKYLCFRRALSPLIKHSCIESLYLVRNFFIAYYFLGYIPRAWISTTMNLQRDSKLQPLDMLSALLNLSLFYHTWLCGTFLLVTWYITWIFFKIYATEAYIFPIQTTFAEETDRCLPKVLSSSPPPIVKDLMLLSKYSSSRRQEVFSLSQPGGHPNNWTAISKECLNLLNNLTCTLITHQEAAAPNGRVARASSSGESRQSSSSSGGSLTEDLVPQTQRSKLIPRTPIPSLIKLSSSSLKSSSMQDPGSPFASSAVNRAAAALDQNSPWYGSVQSPHVMRREPKLWTSGEDLYMNGSGVSELSPVPVVRIKKPGPPSATYLWFQHLQEQVKNFLAKRMLIMYLFSKHPEASSQAVFADSQTHIWALEGLSHLVAASFTEDRFGVVQTTLPSILSTLLTLQEAVEKHFKLPHASSKPPRTSGSLVDTSYKTLRFALRASLKTAIYRITTSFGEHLSAVQVSAEHQKRLRQFLEFRE